MKTGIDIIRRERQRQVSEEGWTSDHDDGHTPGKLAIAAISYAETGAHQADVGGKGETYGPGDDWPWEFEWWKPSDDPVRNLAKAGALIAAEIDRILREDSSALLADESDTYPDPQPGTFQRALIDLVNAYSIENGSNTPDYIVAGYLEQCLDAFNSAIRCRESWYGRTNEYPADLDHLKEANRKSRTGETSSRNNNLNDHSPDHSLTNQKMKFKIGNYYQSGGGRVIHIICEVNTFFHGKSLLAEDQNGNLLPVDDSEVATTGWKLVSGWPRTVYDANSIPEPTLIITSDTDEGTDGGGSSQ